MTKNCWKYIRKVNGEKGIPEEKKQEKEYPGSRKRSMKTGKRHTGRGKQAKKYALAARKEAWKQEKGIPEEEGKQPSMPGRRKKKQENRKKAYQKRNKQEKRYVNLNKILIQFTIF